MPESELINLLNSLRPSEEEPSTGNGGGDGNAAGSPLAVDGEEGFSPISSPKRPTPATNDTNADASPPAATANEPALPESGMIIDFDHLHFSATGVRVGWSVPPKLVPLLTHQKLVLMTGANFTECSIPLQETHWESLALLPATFYTMRLHLYHQQHLIATAETPLFKTVFDAEELGELCKRAEEFAGPHMQTFTFLSHVRSENHPEHGLLAIAKADPERRMLMPRFAPHGHPMGPLKEMLPGTLFSTSKPTKGSPLGDIRVDMHVKELLMSSVQGSNLYFADFYCSSGGGGDGQDEQPADDQNGPNGDAPERPKLHTVTLVLTHKDTPIDQFCAQRLFPLEICNNGFLKSSKSISGPTFFKNSNRQLNIELLYPEPISLLEAFKVERLENTTGAVEEAVTPTAPTNDEKCPTCNLFMPTAMEATE